MPDFNRHDDITKRAVRDKGATFMIPFFGNQIAMLPEFCFFNQKVRENVCLKSISYNNHVYGIGFKFAFLPGSGRAIFFYKISISFATLFTHKKVSQKIIS